MKDINKSTRGLKRFIRHNKDKEIEKYEFSTIFKRIKKYRYDKDIDISYEKILELSLEFYLKHIDSKIKIKEITDLMLEKRKYSNPDFYKKEFIRIYKIRKEKNAKNPNKEEIYRFLAKRHNIMPSTIRRYCKSIKI